MELNIRLTQRSYGGKKFRPKTHTSYEKSNRLLLCVTCWGQEDILDPINEVMKNSIALYDKSSEATSFYNPKENLHPMGNVLRGAVIAAGEKIHAQFNKEEYTAGFEIFAGMWEGPQWVYVSCGQPSVILYREQMGAIPLIQSIDMNVLSLQSPPSDPLPNSLLGLGQDPIIHYGNVPLKPSDRLTLISRPYVPNGFFGLSTDRFNEKEISQVLAEDNPDIPFWLGFVEVH